MKKNKGTKKNKMYVTIDLTDMTKLPSEVILNVQKDLKLVDQAVEEIKNDIVSEVAEGAKNVHWYNKLWDTIKSIF